MIIIVIVFIVLIIIAIVCVLLVYFLKKKKNKDKNNNNSINAVYEIKEKETISFLNPQEIGLKDDDYIIEELSLSDNNLRKLDILNTNQGLYSSNRTGYINISITFYKNLNNLDGLFKNNKNLIEINMKNLEMKEVQSMVATFSACTNLKEINLEGVNSQNLKNMENTFENCKNLKKINLSLNNTSKLAVTKLLFYGCEHLEYLNLTTFQKLNNDMFSGIKSIPVIYGNEYISKDINNFFFIEFNALVNIIYPNIQCIIGANEKCKSCSDLNKTNCLTCNDGYYLPFDDINRNTCKSCKIIIQHCISCFGNLNKVICYLCETGYDLDGNKCIKKDNNILNNTNITNINNITNSTNISNINNITNITYVKDITNVTNIFYNIIILNTSNFINSTNNSNIEYCIIGENEKCKTCEENEKFKNQCKTCNDGYFLPIDDDKTICQSCNKIYGCIECSGTKANPICSKCALGFILNNNKCIEELCDNGEKDKCKLCRYENERKNECYLCNEGYYIPDDIISYNCVKCSIDNCKKCSGKLNNDICLECKNNFITKKDENKIIESCLCPQDYKLTEEGLCQEYENWIQAEIEVQNIYFDSNLHLLDISRIPINSNEIDCYINGEKVSLKQDEYNIYYNFPKSGNYFLKMNIKKTLYTMEMMFYYINSIKTISFLPGFDASRVTSMDFMFYGSKIQIINMKYIKTDSLINLNYFITSSYVQHLDISSFNTRKIETMIRVFFCTYELKEVDLSSFDTSNNDIYCNNMFSEFSRETTVIISNNFKNCIDRIPFENKIINIDDILCKNFKHCIECNGSKETLSCIKCEIGFELKNNICIESKCEIGQNDKCKSCQIFPNHENDCLSCNEGYFLPSNSSIKSICQKCKIDFCKTCDNDTGNCIECMNYYKPIYDINSKLIISCQITCELGNGNKCLACKTEEGKESECSACNKGYKLLKNGICKEIENSFIAIYEVTDIDIYQPVYIMKKYLGSFNITIIEEKDFDIYINGKDYPIHLDYKTYPSWYDYYYTFYPSKVGLYEVKVIFKKTFSYMESLFEGCFHLININFSETFDTSKLLTLCYLFSDCISLKSVNLSSFNTSLVGDMEAMFSNCYSLTSIDLSNFDTNKTFSFLGMFDETESLKYVDLSSFYTIGSEEGDIFSNSPKKGTLIINENWYDKDIPKGWNVKYTN